MGSTAVQGIDFTLPAGPPIVEPPLSLLSLATPLIDTRSMVARLQVERDRAASAAETIADLVARRDTPGEADAEEDGATALEQLIEEWTGRLRAAEALSSGLSEQIALLSRWEAGFQYLPELDNTTGAETWANDTAVVAANLLPGATATKATGSNQQGFLWYDPFQIIGRDDRSTFGGAATDYAARAQRATRALDGHNSWQAEREFWGGVKVPTNYHLTASPSTPLTSPHRTITAFPNPTPAPGTVLGTAVGLRTSLAALDQAIANADAGTGMIHASAYLVQCWSSVYSFLRDPDGKVYTSNHNLIVPGYGYTGMGPDAASRSVGDGVLNSTTTVTSATAAFVAADLGRPLVGAGIPTGAVIASVTNGTTVVLSQAATVSGSGVTISVSGQGGDRTGQPQQWAYATEMVYHLAADVHVYPYDEREMSPLLTVQNSEEVRAEQNNALITNQFLRSAVLVDTTLTT